MINHECRYYNIRSICVESYYITSWILILSHENVSYMKFSFLIHQGCLSSQESQLYVKIRSMIRYGCQYYHMRIIYEGSAYYGSWILILSYEDHIRRIKVCYVVDFGIITQESYTKDCTMKRNLCRFYHMKIIYEDSIMKCYGRRFYYMRIIYL